MADQNQAFLDQVVGYLTTLDITRRRQLAEFLGVKAQTLRSWTRRATVPTGIRSLRLYHLLAESGLTTESWSCTDETLLDVGRLVAFHVITVEDVVATVNAKRVDSGRVVQFLGGYDHVKPEFRTAFEGIVSAHSWDLPAARQKWSHLFIKDANSQKIAALAAKIVDILPLCEAMVSNDWTPEERQELRERCGAETVFNLYNTMGALCGERARQHQLKSAAVSLITRNTP